MTKREAERCHECGGDMFAGTTTYYEASNGRAMMLENVPAIICGQCGSEAFTSAIVREIERLALTSPAPTRTISVPVYEFTDGRYQEPTADQNTVADGQRAEQHVAG